MKAGWTETPLSEVLVQRTEMPSEDDLLSGSVKIVSKISFDTGKISFRDEVGTKTGMILIRPGDLLVSGINAYKGAISIYDPQATSPAAATIHYSAYDVRRNRAEPRFLWWLLRSRIFQERLEDEVPGGIKTELKAARLLPVHVPLPPAPEQRRVLARIEDLAGKIEEAIRLAFDSELRIDAVVDAALRRIFEGLVRRYGLTRFATLITEAGYGTSVKCDPDRVSGSIPVLRIPNVAAEELKLDDLKYGTVEGDLERLIVAEGDLLMVRTNGSADLVGRCAVAEALPEPMLFASYLIRIRFDTSLVTPRFAQLMMKHLRTSGALFDLARTTAGQFNVSLGRLREAKIPIPPLEEQGRIEESLGELRRNSSCLQKVHRTRGEALGSLLPTILARAFVGEL